MSEKRLVRVVPIMATHGTGVPANDTQAEHIQPLSQEATGQARKTVLATPELLETILLFLPAKNTFGVIRVSRAFRACVETSPVIQKKLFFRPSGPPKEVWQVLGPHLSWYLNIKKRHYFRLKDQSKGDPETECLVTPVVLNPCARIVGTSSNYCVTIELPKIHNTTERMVRPKVADLLQVSSLGMPISCMDTYFSQPICEKIAVRLCISLVDYMGIIQAEFKIQQLLFGHDAMTPRTALKACWESSHTLHLWHRGEQKYGGPFFCHWVQDVKISELVETLEEKGKLTAVIGNGTTFRLCRAMVPSEAKRAAVELENDSTSEQ